MRLGRIRHLHLMGIGGVGMCGLAEVLVNEGLEVSGCDERANERTGQLKRQGITVFEGGHRPGHLEGVDAVVFSAAVDRANPEMQAAMANNLPVVRRADMLAELMRRHNGIAVAGTHGKTTTTAIVGHVLSECGLDPTVIAGGRMRGLEAHARRGQGDVLVCEADEFDRSFLALRPVWSVITNVEAEHLDCYGTSAALEAAFASFANSIPFYGAVIVCVDDPGVKALLPQLRGRVVAYGLEGDASLRAADLVASPTGTRFRVLLEGQPMGQVELHHPGVHNVRNSLAAIAVGLELELELAQIAPALASYSGVGRRFELRGERRGVTVVDDYGHHPTELCAVVGAARQAFPGRRVVVAFQPHLFSRTRDFAEGFAAALMGVDVAVVLPVYPAREHEIPGVSSALVVDAAIRLGHHAVHAPDDFAAALDLLDRQLEDGDVLMTVGAGDVDRLGATWLGSGA